MKAFWTKTGSFIIIAGMIAAIYLLGTGIIGGKSLVVRWYWMMGVMLGFIMLIGSTSNNRIDGALVDWRNKMSLSHLQVILWTILGMSAFLTIGLARIPETAKLKYNLESAFEDARKAGGAECVNEIPKSEITQEILDACPSPEALQISFPEELLLAMGISLASFAGSTLVKNNQSSTTILSTDDERRIQDGIYSEKATMQIASQKVDALNKEITDLETKLQTAKNSNIASEVTDIETLLKVKRADMDVQKLIVEKAVSVIATKTKELEQAKKDRDEARGRLSVRKDPSEAEWGDMFKKEIIREERLIDLSKVQMFFFTIAVIFAYAASLNQLMLDQSILTNPFGVALPPFSPSLVILLGISHGGYLVTKNTDTGASTTQK